MRAAAPSFRPCGRRFFLILAVFTVPCPAFSGPAGEVDEARLPPAATGEVGFARDILPLFERSCLRCHGPERPQSRYRLDQRTAALASGNRLADWNERLPPGAPPLQNIIPGDSRRSPLVHYIARLPTDEDLHMPPAGKAAGLSAAEVGLVRAWIDQGAAWEDAPARPAPAFSVTPAIRFITVDGNESVFRQHTGLRAGWGGGLTEFSLRDEPDAETTLTADGRVLGGDEDYRLELGAVRRDLGHVRAGAAQ